MAALAVRPLGTVDDGPTLDCDAAAAFLHSFVGDDFSHRDQELDLDRVTLLPNTIDRDIAEAIYSRRNALAVDCKFGWSGDVVSIRVQRARHWIVPRPAGHAQLERGACCF